MTAMDTRRPRTRVVVAVGIAAATVLLLAACAAGYNPDVGQAPPGGDEPAGFWLGLWHGFILPVTWIVSLFTRTVSPYEVFNSGNWYDFGFVLGITIIFGGPFGAGSAARRR